MNLLIHYALAALGYLCFAAGLAECCLLLHSPIHAAWAAIAVIGSMWFGVRMVKHVDQIKHELKMRKLLQWARNRGYIIHMPEAA